MRIKQDYMWIRILFYVFICCLHCLTLSAQNHSELSVNKIPLELPGNIYLNNISQDGSGYIWFHSVSGALIRVDGYDAKLYPYSFDWDKFRLSQYIVHGLVIDEHQNYWIACARGLIAFNSRIRNYQYFGDDSFGLSDYNYKVSQVLMIEPGRLLFFTLDALYEVRYKTDQNQIKILSSEKMVDFSKNLVVDAWLSDQKVIALGLNKGLTYDINTHQITIKDFAKSEHDSEFWCAYFDPEKNIIIAANKQGEVSVLSKDFDLLKKEKFSDSSLRFNTICKLDEHYYFGTNKGLLRGQWSNEDLNFESNSDFLNGEDVSKKRITNLFCDHSKVLWISTTNQKIYTALKDPSFIQKIGIQSEEEIAHVSYNKEFQLLDDEYYQLFNEHVNIYNMNGVLMKRFRLRTVGRDMYVKGQNILIVDDQGLYVLDRKTGETINNHMYQDLENSFSGVHLTHLYIESDSVIWFENRDYNLTRSVYDSKTKLWTSKVIFKEIVAKWSMGLCFYNDSGENILFYIPSKGAYKYDVKADDLQRLRLPTGKLLPDRMLIECIEKTIDDDLWIGTNKGILYSKNDSGKLNKFKYLKDDLIGNLIKDHENNIWGTTINRLFKINPTTHNIDFVELNDDDFSFVIQGARLLKNREIAFQMNNGEVLLVTPDEFNKNQSLATVKITNVRINNINLDEYLLAKNLFKEDFAYDVNATQKFNYDENNLSFEFAGLDYRNQQNIKYAYRLEGADKGWIYTSFNNRNVSYSHLPPGEYKFIVRASFGDVDKQYVEDDIVFVISSPWWTSWWAYLGYFIFIVSGVLAAWKYSIERYKYQTNLKLEQNRLNQERELNKQKLQFFTNVSHELKTPLSLLIGPLKKLRESDVNDIERDELLDVMQRNSQRLMQLITQVLDFRKISNNKFHLKLIEDDIAVMVANIVSDFDVAAKRKGLKINYSGPVRLKVWFDTEALEKILMNLLSNAIRLTEKGSVFVTLQEVDSKVILSVEDTGPGIAKEDQERIFERFFQSSNKKYSNTWGTGIGLALTKELVELHRGCIKLESQINKGSRFIVEFCVDKSQFEASDFSELASVKKVEKPDKYISEETFKVRENENKSRSVLLIEDNDDLRDFVKNMLKAYFKVLTAVNGREGLELAIQHQPDIVISDIMMPEMDGREFCKKLKTDLTISHIPVILLTAKSLIEHQIEGLDLGADAYVTKPFDPRYLESVVFNLLDSRKNLRGRWDKKLVELTPEEIALTNADQIFLENVIRIIDDNLGDNRLKVEDIYHELGMSHNYFFKKLKALTNQSCGELIKKKRMDKAVVLLKEHGLRVSDVCYSVGFSDPKYFYKVFKAYHGISPSQYAKGED